MGPLRSRFQSDGSFTYNFPTQLYKRHLLHAGFSLPFAISSQYTPRFDTVHVTVYQMGPLRSRFQLSCIRGIFYMLDTASLLQYPHRTLRFMLPSILLSIKWALYVADSNQMGPLRSRFQHTCIRGIFYMLNTVCRLQYPHRTLRFLIPSMLLSIKWALCVADSNQMGPLRSRFQHNCIRGIFCMLDTVSLLQCPYSTLPFLIPSMLLSIKWVLYVADSNTIV
jgi:hypothetical protein